MGKLYILGASVAFAMLIVSCSKEADVVPDAAQPQSASGPTLNVTINTGEVYTLSFPKESELNIHKQAVHFRESTTSVNNETGLMIYKYAPVEGFAGTDEVTLSNVKKVTSYSSGCYTGSYGNQENQMLQKSFTTVKINVIK
jgi:hypothetical protein